MKEIFYLNKLQPADRLVIPKSSLNVIQHHVIYLGKDNNGNRIYIENAVGKCVQVVDEAHLFGVRNELTSVELFSGNQLQRVAALKRAIQLIGKPYDLFKFNCEHYANIVQHQKSYSAQVGKGISLSLFFLFLGIGLSK